MHDVRIERLYGSEAAAVEDELRLIYTEAFAEPPYDKTEQDADNNFRRFRSQVNKAGFRAVLARTADGEPAAMAYGYPLSANTGWWDTLIEPVPDAMRREDGRRTFGLFELAVRSRWRRAGVATALHRALLADAPEDRVLLNTRPEADAAQAAYRAWGYRQVGQGIPWRGAAVHDVMLLDLVAHRTVTA